MKAGVCDTLSGMSSTRGECSSSSATHEKRGDFMLPLLVCVSLWSWLVAFIFLWWVVLTIVSFPSFICIQDSESYFGSKIPVC